VEYQNHAELANSVRMAEKYQVRGFFRLKEVDMD
jgi:hypothetical protein